MGLLHTLPALPSANVKKGLLRSGCIQAGFFLGFPFPSCAQAAVGSLSCPPGGGKSWEELLPHPFHPCSLPSSNPQKTPTGALCAAGGADSPPVCPSRPWGVLVLVTASHHTNPCWAVTEASLLPAPAFPPQMQGPREPRAAGVHPGDPEPHQRAAERLLRDGGLSAKEERVRGASQSLFQRDLGQQGSAGARVLPWLILSLPEELLGEAEGWEVAAALGSCPQGQILHLHPWREP